MRGVFGGVLASVGENLWCRHQALRAGGIELGTRMTVVRTQRRQLLVHSPVALDDQLRRHLDKLGTVRWVVAPNRFHHLWVTDWKRAYPAAALWVARGLPQKRPDLPAYEVLGPMLDAPWSPDLEHELVAGVPAMNEVVFFHAASRTLITADLLFYAGAEAPWMTRLALTLAGVRGEYGTTWLEWLLLRDRAAARRSFERILGWDFDRVIIAHGRIVEIAGREVLRKAYAWLLEE
ncbi:MAG TPA: DUF4336 domain-containing protein [Candidatus Limnocylindrales bacterium]|nr:DUF4336 domain-containing protein [Candidatus Limnocylindrales bacterium]